MASLSSSALTLAPPGMRGGVRPTAATAAASQAAATGGGASPPMTVQPVRLDTFYPSRAGIDDPTLRQVLTGTAADSNGSAPGSRGNGSVPTASANVSASYGALVASGTSETDADPAEPTTTLQRRSTLAAYQAVQTRGRYPEPGTLVALTA